MCSIIGWAGQIPPGLLSRLLIQGSTRGLDATGLVFRRPDDRGLSLGKRAVSATTFVKANNDLIKAARCSPIGLGHCRRSSRGTAAGDRGAHPHLHEKICYVHNGYIRNWRDLDPAAATDSIVIGPAIQSGDYHELVGNYAIAWIVRKELYCLRVNKELEAFQLIWEKGDTRGDAIVLSSTEKIFKDACDGVKNLRYEYDHLPIMEGTVTRVEATGLEPVSLANFNPLCLEVFDRASSAVTPVSRADQP